MRLGCPAIVLARDGRIVGEGLDLPALDVPHAGLDDQAMHGVRGHRAIGWVLQPHVERSGRHVGHTGDNRYAVGVVLRRTRHHRVDIALG